MPAARAATFERAPDCSNARATRQPMAVKPPFLRPGASSPEPHEPTIPSVDEPDGGSRITPRVIYRAVLLAALLVAAGFVGKALLTLLLLVLMTIILALVLSAGAT